MTYTVLWLLCNGSGFSNGQNNIYEFCGPLENYWNPSLYNIYIYKMNGRNHEHNYRDFT